MNKRSEFKIALTADVWGRIVLAAQESEDWKLRTLIEQAAHEAESVASEPPFVLPPIPHTGSAS